MIKNLFYLIIFDLAAVLCWNAISAAGEFDIPVFPGAKGFGTDTRAAYGGKKNPYVYKVTNLKGGGAGSLRNCVEDGLNQGPRICVFEISGTVEVASDIVAKSPYLTIAGQTAPSPGITVKGAAIHIATHDVLIQHIRIRVGDNPEGPPGSNRDGLKISNWKAEVHHVVADHLSVSWAIDENIQLWYRTRDVTVSNSIVAETLNHSLHAEGPHSKNFIVGPESRNTTIVCNLLAHCEERNPLVRGSAEVVDNLMYNFGVHATKIANSGTRDIAVIGNVYKKGRNTVSAAPVMFKDPSKQTKLYLENNMLDGMVPSDPWCLAYDPPAGIRSSSPTTQSPNIVILDVHAVEEYVLKNAGARPADRDAVDIRIIDSVTTGAGSIIDSQRDVGGWPELNRNYRSLKLPANMHGDEDGDGYKNLEEWLHLFSAVVEGRADSTLSHFPESF